MSREAWISVGVVVGVIALVTLYGAIRLAVKLFGAKRMLGELGSGGKWAFYGSLIYAIFPFDILPDPIYLDDMAVLGGALFYLTKLIKKRGGLRGVIPHGRARTDLPPAQHPPALRKR